MWTHKPPPEEYADMLLMERFGWTWQELMDTPSDVVQDILFMWSVETSVRTAGDQMR